MQPHTKHVLNNRINQKSLNNIKKLPRNPSINHEWKLSRKDHMNFILFFLVFFSMFLSSFSVSVEQCGKQRKHPFIQCFFFIFYYLIVAHMEGSVINQQLNLAKLWIFWQMHKFHFTHFTFHWKFLKKSEILEAQHTHVNSLTR